MTLADAIAILRALAVLPVAWALAADARAVALGIFGVAALSDALDGWVARRTRTEAPRGAFLDPVADKILVVGTLVALSAIGTGWPVVVVTILVGARELVVAIARARAFVRGVTLPADRIAKVKTAAEMLGIASIIVGTRPWPVLGAGLVGLAFLVSAATLPRYLTRARHSAGFAVRG